MSSIAFLVLFSTLVATQEYYILQDSFQGGPDFLSNFDFWQSWDPTFGYIHYVDQAVAEQYHMINITNSTVSWGVDTTQILDPDANLGRLSIRLTSIQQYTHGLFILDLAHMPDAACGSWPSFWSLGNTGVWPASGEIDIIELVNQGADNLMSLHTMPGCSIAGADETGTLLSSDCGLGGGFAGCTVQADAPSNSGPSFNAAGGGVYAVQWTSIGIQIWFFTRDAIPETLSSPFPDIGTFGTPTANFEGSCDVDTFFYNHNLVFDIDFCGSWAGPTFLTDGCPSLDPSNSWTSCNEYVALNPSAFTETYWEVNYLNVYQLVPGTAPTTTSQLSSATPAVQTSSVSTALSGALGRSSTPTMSIAGTTPSINTGTFTATSSVLSVLSSLSASSVSASLAGRTVSSSAFVASTTSPGLTTPIPGNTFPTTSVFSTTAIPSTTSLAAIPSSSLLTTSCTGDGCASVVTSIIVQTVTVNAIPVAASALALRGNTERTEEHVDKQRDANNDLAAPEGSSGHESKPSSTAASSGHASFYIAASTRPLVIGIVALTLLGIHL